VLQSTDIEYLIILDEERIPLRESVTLGRHLDNDLVLAGEDVLDYHLRIELGQRGPNAIPLGDSTLRLNERDLADEKVGLVPGDRLHVGQQTLEVEIARRHEPDAQDWQLNGPGGGAVHPLNDTLSVGRAEDNALQLQNDHVSRHHARLFQHLGAVFVQDFGSSNGTFVNGQRIIGGCRLLHGDEVSFDISTPYGHAECAGRIVWTSKVGAFYIWGVEFTRLPDNPEDPIHQLIESSF